jgi:DNA-binding PucR family transcriptional regulator
VGIGAVAAGIDGFRASHRLASAAYSVALARNPRQASVIAATDPGVATAALLGGDLTQAKDWVTELLGDLASDTDNDARLRETLYVFLSAGGSRKVTGEKLNLHSNTVKYRIDRAIARRGRDIGTDRLDVELALLLCHWYGQAVLKPSV